MTKKELEKREKTLRKIQLKPDFAALLNKGLPKNSYILNILMRILGRKSTNFL